MTSTPHTSCTHPATSSARAKCRKIRAAHEAEVNAQVAALKNEYYSDLERDAEEIIADLRAINPALIEGYYDNTLDIEEIMANL